MENLWKNLWIICGLSMDMVDISMAMTQEPIKIGDTYTIYVWPMFQAYGRGYIGKIWPYMIWYNSIRL